MIKKISIKKILTVLLALLAFVSLLQGCRNAINYSQDFQWDAVKVMSLHMNPYDESLNPSEELIKLGYEEYYKQMEANQFPSLLWLLFPYIFLGPMGARYAWLISNLLFTILAVVLMRKTFLRSLPTEDFLLAALLMVAGTPWRNQVGVGNHTIYAFMFFLLSVYLCERNEKVGGEYLRLLSGLCLSVSYFKYTLTVPLTLYFLYKRKYKELIISVIPHVVLTVFSAVWLNDSLPNMIIKPLKVAKALSGEGSMDVGALLGGGDATMLSGVVIMVALILLTLLMPKEQEQLLITILLLWSLVMTYHRSYDYFVLVLPAGFVYEMYAGAAGENKMYAGAAGKNKSKQMITTLVWYYIILLLVLFFGLRLCNEDRLCIYAAAVLYYIFTVALTVYGIYRVKNNKNLKVRSKEAKENVRK